ncbi:MAG: 3-deoxy-D-manno-octulosonic acid transferase [Armatimonadetes bacterium]|nr:3-deoxy-D-manno-octulosonic acid transferase [Armatimonadota bacterium]
MIRFIYNLLLFLLAPAWVPWMIWRAKRRREQPVWAERLGRYAISPREDRKRIWVHAVSVGEVVAARPILKELRTRLPEHELVLTCTTSTGYGIAESLKGKLIDHLFYFPVDVPAACTGAMLRVRPSVVAVMETELWMNFLNAAKFAGAKTCLINGRLSDRSFSRARRLRLFYRALLKNVDVCMMQTERDAERIRTLGAERTEVAGNSKYDETGAPERDLDWTAELQMREGERLIVVGSARGETEEEIVLSALRGLDVRVLFAPRHIERADAIEKRARELGFEVGRRSRGQNQAALVILDTFGELASAYHQAYAAIIGGGFDDLGGQNVIQPLAAGCPVVCGPHMRNFREPFEDAKAAGALLVAKDAPSLRGALGSLLSGPAKRDAMGEAGRRLVESRRGASERYASTICRLAGEVERPIR